MMVKASALAATVVLACSPPAYIEPDPPHGVVVRASKQGMYIKEVVTKKDPDTFVAPDATMCRVSPDLYKSTALHSMINCNWQ